jgi:hypothetical protein
LFRLFEKNTVHNEHNKLPFSLRKDTDKDEEGTLYINAVKLIKKKIKIYVDTIRGKVNKLHADEQENIDSEWRSGQVLMDQKVGDNFAAKLISQFNEVGREQDTESIRLYQQTQLTDEEERKKKVKEEREYKQTQLKDEEERKKKERENVIREKSPKIHLGGGEECFTANGMSYLTICYA